MTTARRPSAVPGPPVSPRRVLLVPAALAVLVAVGCITLGPSGAVADARRTVVAAVEALAAPWPGTVQRAQVEAVANALLFVPVGALAALTLRGRSPVLPVVLGAGASVLVELAQTALPGRVPDPVDVVANTAGTALGVALATAFLTLSRRAVVRRRDASADPAGTDPATASGPGKCVRSGEDGGVGQESGSWSSASFSSSVQRRIRLRTRSMSSSDRASAPSAVIR